MPVVGQGQDDRDEEPGLAAGRAQEAGTHAIHTPVQQPQVQKPSHRS